jgi:hypothetical protein
MSANNKGHLKCAICDKRCEKPKSRSFSAQEMLLTLQNCEPAKVAYYTELQRRQAGGQELRVHTSRCHNDVRVRDDIAPAIPLVALAATTPRVPVLPVAATRSSVQLSNSKQEAAHAAALLDQSLPVYVSKLRAARERLASEADRSSATPSLVTMDEVASFCMSTLTNHGLMPPCCSFEQRVFFPVHPLGDSTAPSTTAGCDAASSSASCVLYRTSAILHGWRLIYLLRPLFSCRRAGPLAAARLHSPPLKPVRFPSSACCTAQPPVSL